MSRAVCWCLSATLRACWLNRVVCDLFWPFLRQCATSGVHVLFIHSSSIYFSFFTVLLLVHDDPLALPRAPVLSHPKPRKRALWSETTGDVGLGGWVSDLGITGNATPRFIPFASLSSRNRAQKLWCGGWVFLILLLFSYEPRCVLVFFSNLASFLVE